jgi:hypothetical protein
MKESGFLILTAHSGALSKSGDRFVAVPAPPVLSRKINHGTNFGAGPQLRINAAVSFAIPTSRLSRYGTFRLTCLSGIGTGLWPSLSLGTLPTAHRCVRAYYGMCHAEILQEKNGILV